MARQKNTGILLTNFPSRKGLLSEELFRLSQYGGSFHFMAEIAACERRALEALEERKVASNTRRPSRKKMIVKIDNSRRPITYPRSREDDRSVRTEFLNRDIRKDARKNPVLLDIHEQLRTIDSFHYNWSLREDALKWIAANEEKPGAENPIRRHQKLTPDLQEAADRYEIRRANENAILVTAEQADTVTDPGLKRELGDYFHARAVAAAMEDGPAIYFRKRSEAMTEAWDRLHQAFFLFAKIVALDKNIVEVRPSEAYARRGRQQLARLKSGRKEKNRPHEEKMGDFLRRYRRHEQGSKEIMNTGQRIDAVRREMPEERRPGRSTCFKRIKALQK